MQRVDLNPMQQAHTLGVLTSAPPKGRGLSQGKVAAGIGKTQAFVSQRVALLKLVPKLQELVATGQLGVREARTFARLPQQEQLAAYERPTPAEPAELQPAATPATPLQPANTEPDPREAGGVGGGKAGAADGSYNPVMGRAGTESFEDEASPSPDEQPADVPEVEPSEGDNQPGVAQHGQPQAVEAAPAAGNSTIPTQQSDSPQEGTTPLSAVDWHDAQAFAEAIRSELSAQEIRALTEQLTASLRVAGASES